MAGKKTILVLGIGNEILSDDGIGPKLVKNLVLNSSFECIEYLTASVGGLEILEIVQGFEKLIIIDAIRTKNGKPGDVYLFDLHDMKETLHVSNFHDVSFITALKLGRALGFKLPDEIRIIAIEIIEDQVFSEEFSKPLQNKFENILREVEIFISTYVMYANNVQSY